MKNKFKIGDKVRVVKSDKDFKQDYIGKVFTIDSIDPNGEMSYGVHYGVKGPCMYVWLESEVELVSSSKIVIHTDGYHTTTATLYENGKPVKTVEANCAPEDKFDFMVGANLAMSRLTEAVEKSKYYNGKVVCVDNCHNTRSYTIGKIYQFVDGVFTNNGGNRVLNYGSKPFTSFEEFSSFTSSKFIPLVED